MQSTILDEIQRLNVTEGIAPLEDYIKSPAWAEIEAQGKEYRLCNIIRSLQGLTDVDTVKSLVEYITSGSEAKWSIVENYCYDFYILNEIILA